MTDELDLGKMSLDELEDIRFPTDEVLREIAERDRTSFGAPGRAPLLSVAQVVETLGTLLAEALVKQEHAGQSRELWSISDARLDAIHACARALLNLPHDAPSPLDDTP